MGRLWRENGLSLAMFGLFAVCVVAQSIAGMREYNEDQAAHGQPAVSYGEYLTEGHFVEAVFENWESEFLQMSAYVLLTVSLFARRHRSNRADSRYSCSVGWLGDQALAR